MKFNFYDLKEKCILSKLFISSYFKIVMLGVIKENIKVIRVNKGELI